MVQLFYTADIMRISGFDESYVGWGREDSDFVTRMLKAGITVRSGRFATCVATCSIRCSRDQFSVNDDKFKKLCSSDTNYQPTKTVIEENENIWFYISEKRRHQRISFH